MIVLLFLYSRGPNRVIYSRVRVVGEQVAPFDLLEVKPQWVLRRRLFARASGVPLLFLLRRHAWWHLSSPSVLAEYVPAIGEEFSVLLRRCQHHEVFDRLHPMMCEAEGLTQVDLLVSTSWLR